MITVFLTVFLLVGSSFGQSRSKIKQMSLCSLQATARSGDHQQVVVYGIFREGLELGTLEDSECPKEATWVELALHSQQNKKKLLRKALNRSGLAEVSVEGEFYGPPLPDPSLPDAIRKNAHPGWGHLGAFRTKLVVRSILSVKTVPKTSSGPEK